MGPLWYVAPTNFLSHLSTQCTADLLALGRRQTFDKKSLIFQAGCVDSHVYLLTTGRVKVFKLSKSGKEVIMWYCLPGEVFGLAELCKGRRRETYAQACESVDVVSIAHDDFKDFLQTQPQAALPIIDLLSCRLRALGDSLTNITTDDVNSRIVSLLSRLMVRYGKHEGDTMLIDITLTHQEIADMVGACRQTVTSVLNLLKRQGILAAKGGRIHILKPEYLDELKHGAQAALDEPSAYTYLDSAQAKH